MAVHSIRCAGLTEQDFLYNKSSSSSGFYQYIHPQIEWVGNSFDRESVGSYRGQPLLGYLVS